MVEYLCKALLWGVQKSNQVNENILFYLQHNKIFFLCTVTVMNRQKNLVKSPHMCDWQLTVKTKENCRTVTLTSAVKRIFREEEQDNEQMLLKVQCRDKYLSVWVTSYRRGTPEGLQKMTVTQGVTRPRRLQTWLSSCTPSCVHVKSLQSYPTLCDSIDHSLPGSTVLGILQGLEWVAMSSSRGSS